MSIFDNITDQTIAEAAKALYFNNTCSGQMHTRARKRDELIPLFDIFPAWYLKNIEII